MKKLVIIDINAILHRAFHALRNFKTKQGHPTGASYGLVNMLELIYNELDPDYIVIAEDSRRHELKRRDVYEDYKANRKEVDEDFKIQFDDIENILNGYNIKQVKITGYEADDVIASITNKFMYNGKKTELSNDNLTQNEEIEIYIVTGDKDISQLVHGNINIALLSNKKDKKEAFKYLRNEEDVLEQLGVKPTQIPDYFGLIGDSSDGIPGVKGVGPGKGTKLIEEYNNLDSIYENIDNIKGKLKEDLENGKEIAYISKKLASLTYDLNIEYSLEDLIKPEKNYTDLYSIFKSLEFSKFCLEIEKKIENIKSIQLENIEKLDLNVNIENPEKTINIPHNVDEKYKIFDTLSKVLQEINKMGEEISIYENILGTTIFDGKTIINIFNEKIEKAPFFECLVEYQDETDEYENNKNNKMTLFDNNDSIDDDIKNLKKQILVEIEKREVVTFNVKEYLRKGIKLSKYFDSMLAWYIIDTENSKTIENMINGITNNTIMLYELDKMYNKRQLSKITEKEKIEFIETRAKMLKSLKNLLVERLKSDGLWKVYDELEIKLMPVLNEMEENGIKISNEYFLNYENELKEKIETLTHNIYQLSEQEFNIDSPKQLGKVLFEDMGIEVVKKTKSGYSTDIDVLEILSLRGIKIAEEILKYRATKKLLSTYVEPIPKLRDKNDRIHTTFNQNGTTTGRLSSTNPNLQNIPSRTDDGLRIRKGFISKDSWSLLSFDYSQIELRVLAELSKDKKLVNAYKNDLDLHDLTARSLFNKNKDETVSNYERSIAKVINFSILYGKTPFGLSKELKIPINEASQYINAYFEQYPTVSEFIKNVIENARKKGYVETLMGTRRYIHNINSTNKNQANQAERMAVNTLVQGTAANILKLVMIKIYEEIKNDNDIKMLLQVHDELIFEVKDDKIEEYIEKIKQIMEKTVKFDEVPLKANGSFAKNWGSLK